MCLEFFLDKIKENLLNDLEDKIALYLNNMWSNLKLYYYNLKLDEKLSY